MLRIPPGEDSLVLRTDFSNESAWQALCRAIAQPVGEFQAYVRFVSDPAFEGVTIEGLLDAASGSEQGFLIIADSLAMQDPEQAVLAVDLWEEPGRTFRFVPSVAWSVENNLFLSNMDFAEFAEAVDEHGVFRGFNEP